MARRRKKRKLTPRLPSRVKRRTRKGGKVKSQQHPELIGLGLVALGIFLAAILYLGWNGGAVGGWVADAFTGAIGAAAYVAPMALVVVGTLMVARSALVDVSPFRTGLAVTSFGLLTTLGEAHGGAIGRGLATLFGLLLGSTGTTILGVLALVVGVLLLTGASAGAPVRRSRYAVPPRRPSGPAVRGAHRGALGGRERGPLPEPAPVIPLRTTTEPPVDAV